MVRGKVERELAGSMGRARASEGEREKSVRVWVWGVRKKTTKKVVGGGVD